MVELRDGPCLLGEVAALRVHHEFNCNFAPEGDLLRTIDGAHPAASEKRSKSEVRDCGRIVDARRLGYVRGRERVEFRRKRAERIRHVFF
jgi:hypothetical protein